VWSSATVGSGGTKAVMQDDGNFVIYTPAGGAVWASNTAGFPGVALTVAATREDRPQPQA